jgi:hypothetical protein
MAETTEIEKKSLEAHVELCAERYRNLDERLDTVNEKISGLDTIIREVHDMVHKMTEKRNDQIINWGLAIIGTLVGTVGFLIFNYVIK